MKGEIKDPAMKKMFDIPDEYYKASSFLRDIKIKYLQYENLTERQIEAFKNTVKRYDEEAQASKDETTE